MIRTRLHISTKVDEDKARLLLFMHQPSKMVSVAYAFMLLTCHSNFRGMIYEVCFCEIV